MKKRIPNRINTDAWREIKKTMSRFLSLFVLSALAVAFLAGLRTTAPDMEYTADDYFDRTHLMDVRVLSTLGLTDSDIAALEAADGVEKAEGAWYVDAIVHWDNKDMIVRFHSISEVGINDPELLEGRLPQRGDECVVEPDLLAAGGLAIGDTISLDTAGTDYEDSLRYESYTIVGTVNSALYMSRDRGTSTIGTGRLTAVAFLPREAYDLDYYTEAYLRAAGTAELRCYDDVYQDRIDELLDRLEPLGKERAGLRYDEVVGEANEKLADAQKEFDDAEAEADEKLGDARRELDDAKAELADAEKKLADARVELADAEKELRDAKKELDDGRKELDDGWQEYNDGVETLERESTDGWQEIADAEQELADALEELEKGEADYADGAAELADGWAEYNDGVEEYKKGLAEYEDGLAKYEDGKAKYQDGLAEYEDGKKKLEDGEEEYAENLQTLTDAQEKYDKGVGDYEQGKADYEEGLARYEDGLARFEEGKAEYEKGLAEYGDGKKKLEDGKKEYADSLRALTEGQEEYDKGLAEYTDGLEKYEAGVEELKKAKDKLDRAEEQLDRGEAQLKAGWEEYNSQKAAFEAGEAQYEQGLKAALPALAPFSGEEALQTFIGAAAADGTGQCMMPVSVLSVTLQGIAAAGGDDPRIGMILAALPATADGLKAMAVDPTFVGQAQLTGALAGGYAVVQGVCAQTEAQLAEGRAALAAAKSELDGAQAVLDGSRGTYRAGELEYLDGKAALAESKTTLREAKTTLEEAKAALDSGWEQLAEGRAELDKGWAELADAEAELEDGRLELEKSEKELLDGKAELDDAKKLLDEAEIELADAKEEIEDGWRQLADGRTELDNGWAELADAEEELEDGRAELADAEKELEDGKAELDDADRKLADAYAELVQGETELADARKKLDDGWQEYNDGLVKLADGRAELIEEVDKAQQELDDAYRSLVDGEAEYRDGMKKYRDGQKEYADGAREYEDGLRDYEDGLKEYEDGLKEYEDAKAEAEEKLSDARRELNDARRKISEIESCKWYILGRNTNTGYVSYQQDAQRMGNLAKVFPLIFFLVAALVCLTTMTRMVEEQRVQIGGLKALGYSRGAVARKYVGYGFLASFLGGVVGLAVGCTLIPTIIFNAWKVMYTVGDLEITLLPWTYAAAVGAAVLCVTGTALAASFAALTAVPATLMRPRAPQAGKRVLLERVGFIWKRLSFTWKVTVRNLFRYKKRFIMAVVGIGGCTALLITGFGLRDSIHGFFDVQYDEITTYNGTVNLADRITADEMLEIERELDRQELVAAWTAVSDTAVTAESGRRSLDSSVYLSVAVDGEKFGKFAHLRDRKTGEPVPLTDDGAVITEKLSEMLGVGVGDQITIVDADNERVQVPITGITENYIFHYIYLSRGAYLSFYGEEPSINSIRVLYTEDTEEAADTVASSLLPLAGVSAVTRTDALKQSVLRGLEGVDYAVIIVVVSAAALAFVVLYNLTNINITERIRELATLKVLGFNDHEMSAYVYRENIFLTVFGILLGLVMGKFLHQWLVLTVEIDIAMFYRTAKTQSYIFSAILTVLFSVLVNIAAKHRLRKIDMVESLKTVE